MRPTFELMLGVLGLRPPRTAVTPAELALLRELASGARCVVEVGVAEGATSAELAHVIDPGAVMYLVDPYPARLKIERVLGVSGTRWIARRSVRGASPRRVFVSSASLVAAKELELPGGADLVFLDAQHDEQSVWDDLGAWGPRLNAAGVVAVHDSRPCSSRPELSLDTGGCRAVERCRNLGWRMVAEAESLAVLVPPSGDDRRRLEERYGTAGEGAASEP